MYETKGDIINQAYSKLRISGKTKIPDASDIELAIGELELIANEIESRNLCTGFNFEEEPDPASKHGLDPGFFSGICFSFFGPIGFFFGVFVGFIFFLFWFGFFRKPVSSIEKRHTENFRFDKYHFRPIRPVFPKLNSHFIPP